MVAVDIIGTLQLCIPEGHGRLPSIGRSEFRTPRLPWYAHFARAHLFSLLPAYGLWRKCSDLSGSRAYGSLSSQHEESLAAHFPLIVRKWLQYATFSRHFSLLRLPLLAEVFPSLLV